MQEARVRNAGPSLFFLNNILFVNKFTFKRRLLRNS